MLARAEYELRLELVERDGHDDMLVEWERSLDMKTRERLSLGERCRLSSTTITSPPSAKS